jgi:hypothetical protein
MSDRVHRQRGADLREGVEEEAGPELECRQRRQILAGSFVVSELVDRVETVGPAPSHAECEPKRKPEAESRERELPRAHAPRAQPRRSRHATGK